MKKDSKARVPFSLRDKDDNVVATGVYYRDSNAQVLWRQDTGWGGEQYQTLANVLHLMPNVKSFHWED